MTDTLEHEVATRDLASVALRLLDAAYVAWLQAETDAGQALRAWSHEKASIRTAAYAAYQAAFDREEAAAADLRRLAALARSCRATGERVGEPIGSSASARPSPPPAQRRDCPSGERALWRLP